MLTIAFQPSWPVHSTGSAKESILQVSFAPCRAGFSAIVFQPSGFVHSTVKDRLGSFVKIQPGFRYITSLSSGVRYAHPLNSSVMQNRMKTFKKLKRTRRQIRFMGLMFVMTGGVFAVNGFVMLLDPESTLSCNGVVTNSLSCKVRFTTFAVSFLVVGIVSVFAPVRWLNHIAVWQSSLPSFFSKRKNGE